MKQTDSHTSFHAACGTVHRLRRLHTGLPTDAIHIKEHDGMRSTIITGTVVREEAASLSCSQCGAATATPAHRDFIRDRLPDHMTATLNRELCPSCAPAGLSSWSLRK
jgi:hypothetical protein